MEVGLRFSQCTSTQCDIPALFIKAYAVAEAIRLYTEAIAGAPEDAELLANRSIAHMSANNRQEALQDAINAVKLRPKWAKAHYRYCTRQLLHLSSGHELLLLWMLIHYFEQLPPGGFLGVKRVLQQVSKAQMLLYRLGTAYMAAHDPVSASAAFRNGLELEPSNQAMSLQAKQSTAQAKYEEQCRAAYQGLYQRDLVLQLRAVSYLHPRALSGQP